MKTIIAIGKILGFAGLLLGIHPSVAQVDAFKERIKAMQKEYAAMTDAHVVMQIGVFESKDDKEPYFKQEAVVKKHSNKYFYQFSGLEMLANDKYLILVNVDQRHVSCSLRDLKNESALNDAFSANLDSLLNFYGTPVLASKESETEHFILTASRGDIKAIALYINTTTNTLKRMEYKYAEGQYVTIDFTVFDRSPSFTPDEFSEQRYFVRTNGALKLNDTYSRFRLTQ